MSVCRATTTAFILHTQTIAAFRLPCLLPSMATHWHSLPHFLLVISWLISIFARNRLTFLLCQLHFCFRIYQPIKAFSNVVFWIYTENSLENAVRHLWWIIDNVLKTALHLLPLIFRMAKLLSRYLRQMFVWFHSEIFKAH